MELPSGIRHRHSFDFSIEFSTSPLRAFAISTLSHFHEVSRAVGPKGQRRNYSQNTIDRYIFAVEDFCRHFQRPPDRLAPQHIREYQAASFRKPQYAANTVALHLAALRFFCTKTLRKSWSIADTPYPKRARRDLPIILSQEGVAQLIEAACTPYHRTLLMALYATGVRRAELVRLRITDIDSKRMVVHIKGGKGRKDRDVMLSPTLLTELREH